MAAAAGSSPPKQKKKEAVYQAFFLPLDSATSTTDSVVDYTGLDCLLGISRGQKYHDKPYLQAAVNLLKGSGFKRITCMIADTLQAYIKVADDLLGGSVPANLSQNMVEGLLKSARTREQLAGERFYADNKEVLEGACDVTHWDQYLSDPNYRSYKTELDSLYASDQGFKIVVNIVVNSFLRQHLDKAQKDQSKAVPFDKRWNETKNKDLISSLLREYLLEELAVLLLWIRHPNEYHYNFTAYPRENNLAAQYLISKYLASASESNSAAPFCRELVYQFREIPKEDPFTVVNVTAGEARKRQKKGAEAELQAERKGDAIQKAKKKASKSEFTVFHGSSQALVGAVRNQSRIWDIVSSTNGNGSGKSPLPDEVGQDIEDILESLKSECKMLALKAKASLRHGLSPQADEALASLQHLRDALTRAGVEYASSESGSDGDSEEQKEKQGERGFSPGPAPGGSSGSGDS